MSTLATINRNVIYLQQQIKALIENTSRVISLIIVVIVFGYILSFFATSDTLSISPGQDFLRWFWTIFTYSFIEIHFYEVLIDIITLSLLAKLLEPLWGRKEIFKFFILTNIGVAVLSTAFFLLIYALSKNSYYLFEIYIHGLCGFIMAISVAVRQILPDHLIIKTKYGCITNRNIPLLLLVFSIILRILDILDETHPVMLSSGLLVSWVYLRFYQKHVHGFGDSSESFTFISFFPQLMQPFVGCITNPIYILCQRIGLKQNQGNSGIIPQNCPQIVMDPHNVERRRQIAMRALNERLKQTNENKTSLTNVKTCPKHGAQQHNCSNEVMKPHMVFTKESVFIPPAIPLPYTPLKTEKQDTILDL